MTLPLQRSADQAERWRPLREFENLYTEMDRLAQSVFGGRKGEGAWLPEADIIETRWKARFDGHLDIVRSHRLFVEGNPRGVSKGSALAWLAQRLGIPRERVLAVGDNDNDRSMIEWAGVGVAMGNSPPTLQAIADWVAPSVEGDGVAAALDRFVLHHP